MRNVAVIDWTGPIDPSTHSCIRFVHENGTIERLSYFNENLHENPQFDNKDFPHHHVQNDEIRSRIPSTDELVILDHTVGGSAFALINIRHLIQEFSHQCSTSVYMNTACSAGASLIKNLDPSAQVNVLGVSKFMWHYGSQDVKSDDPEDVVRADELWSARESINLHELICFIQRRCKDKQSLDIIISYMLEHNIIRPSCDDDTEPWKTYNIAPNGTRTSSNSHDFPLELTGFEMNELMNGISCWASVEAFRTRLSESLSQEVCIGKVSKPWNRFMSEVQALVRLREEGMVRGSLVYNPQDHIVLKARDTDSPKFTDIETAIMNDVRMEVFGVGTDGKVPADRIDS